MCITVSTEGNSFKRTHREISESWSNNTSLVPLVVSSPRPIEGDKRADKKVGALTGIIIYGTSNLTMCKRRWKKKVARIAVVKQTKKDLTAYALSKALQMQEHG